MRKTINPSASTVKARRRSARQTRHAAPEMRLRRILVPLDFSGQSRQALDCAVPLAATFGAKISLLHVVQPPVVMRTMPDGGIAVPVNTDRLVELAGERLEEMAAGFLPARVRGNRSVREGSPAYEIIAAAEALKADLIVLSTHGFTGLKRVLLGSTAERVVRHAHCPVLTVHRRTDAPAQVATSRRLPWRRMMVPLDFSKTSLRALDTAIPLAGKAGARLRLLHAVEPAPYAAGMEGAVLAMPEPTLVSAAKTNLKRVARRFVPASIRVTSRVERGQAASVIVQTAETEGTDLIVLSTHGHTGWNRLLLASTPDQVVRRAGCPVFVVRKPHG
jgi:nucleotide-binding universal stress UspA family protein